MGPNNPWSPAWRPDPTGRRLATIRVARRGAVLAGVVYLPIGAAALVQAPLGREVALTALVVGLPGVALLGAGLAPATLGSRIDAVVVGIAFAIGAPVAAVTSIVIGAFLLDVIIDGPTDLAAPILRGGVSLALGVAPLVGLGAASWTCVVRWLSRERVPAT
jgi:hypothetical protein